jgi:hypothetical protein
MTDDEAWMRENDLVYKYARDIDRFEPGLKYAKSLLRMMSCATRYGEPHDENTLVAAGRMLNNQIHLLYRLAERRAECKCDKCTIGRTVSETGEKK